MRISTTGTLLLIPMLAGCPTILARKTTPVSMNSHPTGAEVWIDFGNRAGTTPVTVTLDHRKEHVIVFTMDGYAESSCRINRKVGAGWVVLDVIFGLIPVIVDAATGSWHSLGTEVCNVQLMPGDGSP